MLGMKNDKDSYKKYESNWEMQDKSRHENNEGMEKKKI